MLNGIRQASIKKGELGVSSYDAKKYVALSTWHEHIDDLHNLGLIVPIENKTNETKRKYKGKKRRKRFPYKVTPAGFFALIKSDNLREIKKPLSINEISKIIPHIFSHWKDLAKFLKSNNDNFVKTFDDILFTILRKSVSQIELKYIASKKFKKNPYFYKNILERVSIHYEGFFTLTLEFTYGVHSKKESEDIKKNENREILSKEPILITENYTELDENIVSRLTFLFYYNLMRMGSDEYFTKEICFKIKGLGLDKECIDEIEVKKLNDRFKNIKKYVLTIINTNKDLKKIINNNLELVAEHYKMVKGFSDFQKTLVN